MAEINWDEYAPTENFFSSVGLTFQEEQRRNLEILRMSRPDLVEQAPHIFNNPPTAPQTGATQPVAPQGGVAPQLPIRPADGSPVRSQPVLPEMTVPGMVTPQTQVTQPAAPSGGDAPVRIPGQEGAMTLQEQMPLGQPDPFKPVQPMENPEQPVFENLAKGAKGSRVTTLQENLTDLGYNVGGIDGIFGGGVQRGLKKFQKDFGLPETGIYDRATAEAMADAPEAIGQQQDPRGEANEYTKGYEGGEAKATVSEFMPVFGWEGRNGPSQRQQDAFELLKRKAIEAGITGTELQQLLAQAAVESQWYTKTVEGGGGSASNISGGKRYLGRGPIQLTHDFNYRLFGQSRGEGDKYVNNPELLNDPELATEASLWFWKTNVQPNVTDFSDTFAVSGLINRGSAKKKALHLKEREKAFASISIDGAGGPQFIAGTDQNQEAVPVEKPASNPATDYGPLMGGTYKVRTGDSLSRIAADNGMSLQQLLDLNPDITNPSQIFIGQELNLGGEAPVTQSQKNLNVQPLPQAKQLGMIGGVRDASRVWQSFGGSGMAHSTDYVDYSQLFREYTTTKKKGYIEVGKTEDGQTVYAAPDYAKDKAGNYIMVSKDDAVRMAGEMNSLIPTREWVKSAYSNATRVRMPTQPIYKTPGSTGDSALYTSKINEALKKKGIKAGAFIVHGKEFFVSR